MNKDNNKEIKPVNPLNHLFDPKAVHAKKTARDWSEAVQIAGQYLVDSGKVEVRYVEAMERVILEIGPYAVIAPGIVLLHARPEDGVIKPCFGLITLSLPVPFGHSQNDPVDLVFTMGAIDKSGHIQALQRLANLLGDPTNLEKLRAAEDDQTLLAIIQ
jgi:mannitol/fructose-specific phosphotransferase system IIA component (Ntr-type)